MQNSSIDPIKSLKMVWLAFVLSPLVQGYIAYDLHKSQKNTFKIQEDSLLPFLIIFSAISIGVSLFINAKQREKINQSTTQNKIIRKIIVFAFAETPAILGLVYLFLSYDMGKYFLFVGSSLLTLLVVNPFTEG